MSRVTAIFGAVIVFLIIGLGWAVNHYRDNAVTYKEQRDKATERLNLANATIVDMTVRQRDNAALDAKYTKELADANAENDALRKRLDNGRKRLQISARCPTNGAASTARVDDGAGPRLTDTAERDYFTLRERIETVSRQLTGLQAYVREQCLR